MKKLSTTALFLAGVSSMVIATEVQASPNNETEQVYSTTETLFQSPFYTPPQNSYTMMARTSSVMSAAEQSISEFTNVDDLVNYVIANLNSLNTDFSAKFIGDATSLIKNKELLPLVRAVRDEDDYLNGIGASAGYKVSYTSSEATFTFEASYFITKEQQAFVDQEVKRIVSEIIRPGMSDLEKVLKINEYIVLNTTYSFNSATTPHAAYALFKEGKGVCQAYAMAAYHMFIEAGLEAHYVTGYAGEAHAWNLVKVDGEWFHIDPTWNDPTFQESFTGIEQFIRYQYFLLSDATLLNERQMDKRANLPKATSERFAAVRSIQSARFTFNGVPYNLLPEYMDNTMYYVRFEDRSFAIDMIRLDSQNPIAERFANVRAMDILATPEAIYFVDLDKRFGLSKIDLQTGAVTNLYTGDPVTGIQLNGDTVQAFNNKTVIYSEKISLPVELEPTLPAQVEQLIAAIDTLNEADSDYLKRVEQLYKHWQALSSTEQALVSNKDALLAAKTKADSYTKQINDLTNAIAALNKAAALNLLVEQVATLQSTYDNAHSIVQAGVTNIELLQAMAAYVKEQQANEQAEQSLVKESEQLINNMVFLNKNFAQQAEQLLSIFTVIKDLLSAEAAQKLTYIQTQYNKMKNLTFDKTTPWSNTQTIQQERKPWTVVLSQNLANTQTNRDKIQVVDMFGDPVDVTIAIDDKKIIVTPNANYEPDIPYTLVIEAGLQSASGKILSRGQHLTFYFK